MTDTAEKRRSTIGVSYHYYSPGVTPNTLKDQEWRQQSGHGYSGILADEPVIVVLIPRKHFVEFESISQSAAFESEGCQTLFSSASQSVIITSTDNPTAIGFLLLENGSNILLEDDSKIFREENP